MSLLVLNAVGAALPVLVLEPLTERIGRVKTGRMPPALAIMCAGYVALYFFGDSKAVNLHPHGRHRRWLGIDNQPALRDYFAESR